MLHGVGQACVSPVQLAEGTHMGWVIMIAGLFAAAVLAVFIDAWDRRARQKPIPREG
jgi:hypothetical protein